MRTATIQAESAVPATECSASDGLLPKQRFTLDGDDGLERHLALNCEKILIEVQQIVPPYKLEALVLGGGYGRGEGGVLRTDTGDRPYNDLEFYVFLSGNRFWNERTFRGALAEMGERLSPEAGLHVEFKVDSLGRLRRGPVTMFSYDLASGHRKLTGITSPFVGCKHHLDAGNIPPWEATRLLLNRCSGLLFAREKLRSEDFTADDADFVQRNIAKAQLAFGDALLTVHGQYHWSCQERHHRLMQLKADDNLPWLPEVRHHHAAGMKFKLHPFRTSDSRSMLLLHHTEITAFALKIWLWLESRRLGVRFESAREYALSPVVKRLETKPWRNFISSLKVFGSATCLRADCLRHPSERILNSLALLLWESRIEEPELSGFLLRQLQMSAFQPKNIADGYRKFWPQVC